MPACQCELLQTELPDLYLKLKFLVKLAEISREMEADLMEQKVHELDARLRQMKEERDQVIAENDELQVSIINLVNR